MGGDYGWSGGDRLYHHELSSWTGYSPDHLRCDRVRAHCMLYAATSATCLGVRHALYYLTCHVAKRWFSFWSIDYASTAIP